MKTKDIVFGTEYAVTKDRWSRGVLKVVFDKIETRPARAPYDPNIRLLVGRVAERYQKEKFGSLGEWVEAGTPFTLEAIKVRHRVLDTWENYQAKKAERDAAVKQACVDERERKLRREKIAKRFKALGLTHHREVVEYADPIYQDVDLREKLVHLRDGYYFTLTHDEVEALLDLAEKAAAPRDAQGLTAADWGVK